MDKAPNILLVVSDQWRADALGIAGHPVVDTPHLDALAQQGIRFTSAFSAVPSCVAARAALLSGLHQRNHGITGYNDAVEWPYKTTLPGTLSDAGYQTHCIGKMHVCPPRSRMGFDSVELHDGYLLRNRTAPGMGHCDDYAVWLKEQTGIPSADDLDQGLGCNGYAVNPWMYDERLHPSSWVTSRGIEFFRRRDTTVPFFLKLSYHRPHPPLDPPFSYMQRYMDRELPQPPLGDWVDWNLIPNRGVVYPVPHRKHEQDLARRAYYAQLTFIDTQLNRIFLMLKEDDVGDNTVILFVSDHGEMLFDHNFVAKSLPMEGSARIPFILYIPPPLRKKWGIGSKGTVDNLVELRDIFPTLCDIAGLPRPETIDGHSVLPLCRDGAKTEWRSYLQGEHARLGKHDTFYSNFWITDGQEKYVWFSQSGKELLLDVNDDPQELHNYASDRPERTSALREMLVKELSGREEGYVKDGKLVVGRTPQSTQKSVFGKMKTAKTSGDLKIL